jgi:hypothetical protein
MNVPTRCGVAEPAGHPRGIGAPVGRPAEAVEREHRLPVGVDDERDAADGALQEDALGARVGEHGDRLLQRRIGPSDVGGADARDEGPGAEHDRDDAAACCERGQRGPAGTPRGGQSERLQRYGHAGGRLESVVCRGVERDEMRAGSSHRREDSSAP